LDPLSEAWSVWRWRRKATHVCRTKNQSPEVSFGHQRRSRPVTSLCPGFRPSGAFATFDLFRSGLWRGHCALLSAVNADRAYRRTRRRCSSASGQRNGRGPLAGNPS